MPVADKGYLPLEAWNNLYVVMSASAATLLGLLFVIITLAAERKPFSEANRVRIYLTPTAVYFASVLLLACVLTFPTQSRLSATLCCCIEGAVGISYALSLLRQRLFGLHGRGEAWPYSLLPAAAFSLLVGGGATAYISDPGTGLTMVAVAMVALLALALRNSWAMAVTVILYPSEDGDAKGSKQ